MLSTFQSQTKVILRSGSGRGAQRSTNGPRLGSKRPRIDGAAYVKKRGRRR